MGLSYRAYFTVDGAHDVLSLVREQLHSWLRHPYKGYDADRLGLGGVQAIGTHATGVVLEEAARDGSQTFRARIDEETRPGERWISELTAHVPSRPGASTWVWLDVAGPDDGPMAKTPRLARGLLEVLPASDGGLRLSTSAEKVGEDDVEALVRGLTDPDRRGLTFVAGSSEGWPLQPWRDFVGTLLRPANGLASGYVLDAAATRRFSELTGPTHAVAPATIRTFEPRVLLDDRADALRHRVLGTSRLASDRSEHLARVLSRRARDLALTAPLPRDVVRLDQVLRRRLDEDLVARARPSHRPVPLLQPDPAAPLAATLEAERRSDDQLVLREAFTALMVELTGSRHLTLDAVEQLRAVVAETTKQAADAVAQNSAVDQLQSRIRDLEAAYDLEHTRRRDLETSLEDEVLERLVAEEERAAAQLHLREIQKRFTIQDTDGSLWVAPAAEAVDVVPENMADLLDRLASGELDRVVFTGDPGDALDLDAHHAVSTSARKAWEALLALQDYAVSSIAGRCPRDVHGYLTHLPPGCHGYSATRHAQSETSEVQNTPMYASLRVRRVPPEVDPSGRAAMWAHFKLTQSGMTSPRLHYLDDTSRTGKVYVGYIGAHLRTRSTN